MHDYTDNVCVSLVPVPARPVQARLAREPGLARSSGQGARRRQSSILPHNQARGVTNATVKNILEQLLSSNNIITAGWLKRQYQIKTI